MINILKEEIFYHLLFLINQICAKIIQQTYIYIGGVWQLVLSPDFKSVCRGAERPEVCSIRTHPRHSCSRGKKMSSFDIVVLFLLGLGAITGFQKGLITGLARLAGKIAAIVVALLFHQQFLSFIEPVFNLRGIIEPRVVGLLTRIVASQTNSEGSTETFVQPMLTEATIVITDYALKIIGLLLLFIVLSVAINIFITLVVTPLAKSLGIVNRGGGLAFGALSTIVVLCLVVGIASPFLSTANSGIINTSQSFLYPWLLEGYQLLLSFIGVFDSELLTNPFEALPIFNGTPI